MHPDPLSERGGIPSNIHCNIKYLSRNNINQFPLGVSELVVKAPERASLRMGVVILDKSTADISLLREHTKSQNLYTYCQVLSRINPPAVLIDEDLKFRKFLKKPVG